MKKRVKGCFGNPDLRGLRGRQKLSVTDVRTSSEQVGGNPDSNLGWRNRNFRGVAENVQKIIGRDAN